MAQKSLEAGVAQKPVAQMAKKCSLRTSLCQNSSDRNPNFLQHVGLDASDMGAVRPSPGAQAAYRKFCLRQISTIK